MPAMFDTYRLYKHLLEAGCQDKRASAITRAINEVFIQAFGTEEQIKSLKESWKKEDF